MQIEPAELAAMVIYQLGALAGIARAAGAPHDAHELPRRARATWLPPTPRWPTRWSRPWRGSIPTLIVISSTSRAIEAAAARCGLRVATTFLADRACDAQRAARAARLPDSVIHDETLVLARVRRLLREGMVETYDGND